MIVCTKCGFHNEDSDTFCGSCAGFLEWSGQQVAKDVEPEPEPAPEPELEEEHAGFIERVKDRIGIGETKEEVGTTNGVAAGAPAVAPQPEPAAVATGPAPMPAPPVASPLLGAPAPPPPTTMAPIVDAAAPAPPEAKEAAPPPPAAGPTQPVATTPATHARTSQAPPPGATPPTAMGPVQPEAVKPVAAKARPTPRSKVAPSRVVNPGDLICGQCAEGNDPARKFCRRCGASLQEAVVFHLPWYRRAWRRITTRTPKQAGARPSVRRRMVGGSGPGWLTSWVTRIIVLAILVVVVLAFVGPWRHTIHNRASRYYHDVINVVHPSYNPVHPVSARATSSAPGHPAAFAIDGASNTSWQTGGKTTGKGQALVISLAGPTNIDKVGFLNGDSDSQGAYLTELRPTVVHMYFGGAHPYEKNFTLKDSASFQSFTLKAKSATSIILTIESVYPSVQGKHTALAEVELFKKS
jgi:hypothetical protein